MKQTLFTIISLLFAIGANAQNITGYVVDEQQQPIPYANVVLLNADSTFNMGVITAEDGRFAIAAGNQKCIMRISNIGYVTRYITTLHNDMGKICLTADSLMLSEVVVKGHVPQHKLTSEA